MMGTNFRALSLTWLCFAFGERSLSVSGNASSSTSRASPAESYSLRMESGTQHLPLFFFSHMRLRRILRASLESTFEMIRGNLTCLQKFVYTWARLRNSIASTYIREMPGNSCSIGGHNRSCVITNMLC